MSGTGAPGGAKADGSGSPGRSPSAGPTPGNLNLPGGADPSMEDILASIRRILSEDENAGGRPTEPAPQETPKEPLQPDVFNLDASMIVDEPARPALPATSERFRPETVIPEPTRSEPAKSEPARPEPVMSQPVMPERVMPERVMPEPAKSEPIRPEPFQPETVRAASPEPTQQLAISPQPGPNASADTLVAPAAAAAAAMSIGSLRRTLDAERQPGIRGTGITVEEMVREELRPMLKVWLDENLPPIVERLVRAEIERVVGRSNA